jgi:deoxyribonuclease V
MGTTQKAACSFSISKAKVAQTCLSKRIIAEDRLPSEIRLVAGVDVAYAGEKAIGAATVLEYESLELVESKTAVCSVKFPYVPTLLSFREIPAAVACVRKLNTQPDVFLVDGHGMAHPRRCGFASQLGLAIGKPTGGVAKNWLVGEPTEVGGDVVLIDDGETIGSVVTTRKGAKPVYVSVGHLISLKTAVRVVKHCARNSRIPEPLLQAHRIATKERELQKT